jgi:HEAT repeat protein
MKAAAQPAGAASRSAIANADARAGQAALSVGFDATGQLRLASCPRAPCPIDNGRVVSLPPEARANAKQARLSVVGIGQQRRAIHVLIPLARGLSDFEVVSVAPLGAGEPQVLFEGVTGLVQGEHGERRGPMVLVTPEAGGEHRIVVGEQREDLMLCGRPAILSPRMLLAADLKLHPAKVQRLSAEHRAGAVRVTAERRADSTQQTPAYPVLRAVVATSAIGNPAALTDGNPATSWAENRGGSGRGEFVLMKAPPELPLTGFEVVARPSGEVPANAVSPREFYLATNKLVFHVTLPEDAWKTPGASFVVRLPEPVSTDCVALVTDTAYDEGRDAHVTFAELRAQTEFDATAVEGLVGALAGGGERAQAAASALSALGAAGFKAVAEAYSRLDEGGQRVALDMLDAAPCDISAPIFTRALMSPHRAHRIHASARILRCGAAAAAALEEALRSEPRRAHPLFASQLSLIAPDRAVRAIVPTLDDKDKERRRLLRVALGRAVQAPEADVAIRETLRGATLAPVAAIDLLRALGNRIPTFAVEASPVLARLTGQQATFRTKFLLLEPAARLAARDASARRFVEDSLWRDRDPHLRGQAARVVTDAQQFRAPLLRAVEDPQVRVREAAVETLGAARASYAAPALARRLEADPWPLVRAASANALAQLGPDGAVDSALASALEDPSAHVRRPVLLALGERRARRHAEDVRDRLDDRDEDSAVRAAAASALGSMCDTGSLTELTRYARLLADPTALQEQRVIGTAALGALARLRPADLKQRVAPLLDVRVPMPVRQAAQAALSAKVTCGRQVR